MFLAQSGDIVSRGLLQKVWRTKSERPLRDVHEIHTRQRACHACIQLGLSRQLFRVSSMPSDTAHWRQILLSPGTHILRERQSEQWHIAGRIAARRWHEHVAAECANRTGRANGR